jgi:hypothetical protein
MTNTPDFDPNKIAVELIHRLVRDTGKGIASAVRDFFSRLGDALSKDFQPYLESTIKKCSWVKTLIINHEGPTFLFDIYVQTRLSIRGKTAHDSDLVRDLPSLRSVVIEGSGGAGKSMLMRYLFLALCENSYGKLPIFVELRTLNAFSTKDLSAFIYHSITGPGAVFTRDQFNSGLRAGSFCIILDGFDEVDIEQRTNIEEQILRLRETYPELILVVSSRPDPDNRFQSWTKFHVCRVQPMTEKQVNELIEKLDYDTQIKKKFLKALKDSLFRTHASFLSNPLLCIMMLKGKKDASIVRGALNDLAEARDPRLFAIGKNRVRSGQFQLQESDRKWLQKTRVPDILENHRLVTLKLLDEVQKAVADQSWALAELL